MLPSLRIQRLHAHTEPGAQPVAARLVLQSLGAELAEVLPAALAPQALLMLRRLHLSLPAGALRQWPDAALRQQLRETGRRQLSEAAAQARRPALDGVGDDAPAVLFADEAELLACLARDALRDGGVRLARWWWRDLLQGAWPNWRSAFDQRPQAVPAARRLLMRGDAGLALALRLALDGAAFDPAPTLSGQDASPRGAPLATLVGARKPRQQRGIAAVKPGSSDPPLAAEPVLPGTARADERAEPDQALRFSAKPQAPLAATLMPVRLPLAPAWSAAAARDGVDVARSVDAAAPSHHALPAVASLTVLAATPPAHADASQSHVRRQRSRATAALATMPAQAAAAQAATPLGPPATRKAQRHERLERPESTAPSATHPSAHRPTSLRSARPLPDGAPLPRPEPRTAPRPEAAHDWPLPQALTSPQARLLLLVGALQDDGLYPDFTRPRDAGFPLPIWQLLAALGAQWLGAAAVRRDPLWRALLSRSAARPRLKPAQLADWWPLAGGEPQGAAGLAAWLRGYSLALRQRLLLRLAIDDADFNAALTAQPGERPARVWLSEAEIVAVFDLNHHPLVWRLAGLDRDPGFLPSAGMSLRYRFE